MTGECPHPFGVVVRLETCLEQPVLVQQHQPFGIRLVGFPLRYVLHVPCVGQYDIQPVLLKTTEQRYPVNPGGFHCDCLYAAFPEPCRDGMQVGCICSERTVVVLGAVSRNADLHDTVRDVYPRRVGIDYPKFRTFGGLDFFCFLCHGNIVTLVDG